MYSQKRFESPVGCLRLIAGERALVGVYFPDHHPAPSIEAEDQDDHPILEQAARELDEYFCGRRREFTTPLSLEHGTHFQRSVWSALEAIPFGSTRSYAELARAIGRTRAVRAVGAANGRNPISILVPCHRVVGADGSLTGYAGGTNAKRWLLTHERSTTRSRSQPGSRSLDRSHLWIEP